MEHLTAEQARTAGFRLQQLEVFNWGTFHHHVWVMQPGGATALLTGANGSGKSTLVDALLTLLVPPQKRSYNQASGGERKRERDERSYARGAYGRLRSEDDPRGTVQYLRGSESYSVLLARFADAGAGQEVTLAQLFWYQDGELKRLYVVAPMALSVAAHCASDGDMKALTKRLKALGAEVSDNFAAYGRQFCKLFGLRSEQALDLFGQIVSIKEIGGLNDFVRGHMLERSDGRERIAQLRANYENLTRAHDAIEQAERRLARLQPLLADGAQWLQKQAQIAEAERCAAAAPAYIARRKQALLERAIGDANAELARHQQLCDELKARLDEQRERAQRLFAAIENDQAGQRIQQIQQELSYIAQRRDGRRVQATRYSELARQLGLVGYSDEATFEQTRRMARDNLPKIEARLNELSGARDQQLRQVYQQEADCAKLRDELETLRRYKSQLPSDDLRIRAQLAAALGLAEQQLPFIGELLKVRDDEQPWEAAIERLLRGYGRQLLVPEELYRQVSQHVNVTNLRGRLVYHRVSERRVLPTPSPAPELLAAKLDVRPDSSFYAWLRADLSAHWDYTCCASLEQFQRERRAVTSEGQIKHNAGRHEKDDSRQLGDRRFYILGWDNRTKIAALEADLQGQERALLAAQRQLQQLERDQQTWQGRRDNLGELLRHDDFASLDWQADQRQIDDLEAEQRRLAESADQLKALRAQLADVKHQIDADEQRQAQAQTIIGTMSGDLKRFAAQHSACLAQRGDDAELLHHSARLDGDLNELRRGEALTLATIDTITARLIQFYQNSHKTLQANLSGLQSRIVGQMEAYRGANPEESADLVADIGALDEFRQLLDQLEREDLPRHKRRFKELLNEKVLLDVATFSSALDSRVDDIRAGIERLNGSLHGIDYTPATYIKLCQKASRDAEITEFRQALRSCLADVGQTRTAEANEASFQKIRALIQRFAADERWTERVTDVRRWLDFSAEELYREDHSVKNYYNDSSGKSGGQKAKLAYTILASAIAYQYGLGEQERAQRSFRFVVIDEAFSKSDEDNSRYAMQLFRQLGLQLLVVTPLDKTHVVEPFIAACHFVANSADENESKVYNLTIAQYHEQKALFQSGALAL